MKDYAKCFYLSKAWKDTRNAYYTYRNGLCERCKEAGDIVHHKRYLRECNIHNSNITLDWSNLELLCQDCHNKEHMSKTESRYSFDELGNILPP